MVMNWMALVAVLDGTEITDTTRQFLRSWQANKDAINQRLTASSHVNGRQASFEAGQNYHSNSNVKIVPTVQMSGVSQFICHYIDVDGAEEDLRRVSVTKFGENICKTKNDTVGTLQRTENSGGSW